MNEYISGLRYLHYCLILSVTQKEHRFEIEDEMMCSVLFVTLFDTVYLSVSRAGRPDK